MDKIVTQKHVISTGYEIINSDKQITSHPAHGDRNKHGIRNKNRKNTSNIQGREWINYLVLGYAISSAKK